MEDHEDDRDLFLGDRIRHFIASRRQDPDHCVVVLSEFERSNLTSKLQRSSAASKTDLVSEDAALSTPSKYADAASSFTTASESDRSRQDHFLDFPNGTGTELRERAKANADDAPPTFNDESFMKIVSETLGPEHEVYRSLCEYHSRARLSPDFAPDALYLLAERLYNMPKSSFEEGESPVDGEEKLNHLRYLRARTLVLLAARVLREVHFTYALRRRQKEYLMKAISALMHDLVLPTSGDSTEFCNILKDAFQINVLSDEAVFDALGKNMIKCVMYATAYTDRHGLKDALATACTASDGVLMLLLSYRHDPFAKEVCVEVALRSSSPTSRFTALIDDFREHQAFSVFPDLPPLIEDAMNGADDIEEVVDIFQSARYEFGRISQDALSQRVKEMLETLLRTIQDASIEGKDARGRSIVFVKAICIVRLLWYSFRSSSIHPQRFVNSPFRAALDSLGQRVQANLFKMDPHVALAFFDLISSEGFLYSHDFRDPRMVRLVLRARDCSLEMPQFLIKQTNRSALRASDGVWRALKYLLASSSQFVDTVVRLRLEMTEYSTELVRYSIGGMDSKRSRLISDWSDNLHQREGEEYKEQAVVPARTLRRTHRMMGSLMTLQANNPEMGEFDRPESCWINAATGLTAFPRVVHTWSDLVLGGNWRNIQRARTLECILYGWYLSHHHQHDGIVRNQERLAVRQRCTLRMLTFDIMRTLLSVYCKMRLVRSHFADVTPPSVPLQHFVRLEDV